MPDGDNKKKMTVQDFVSIDREKMYGDRPTTLATNRTAPADEQKVTTAKPADTDTSGTTQGSAGQSKGGGQSIIDEILGASSYEEIYAQSVAEQFKAKSVLQEKQKSLSGKIRFDSKGQPSKVNINGVWTDIDNAIAMPEDIEAALDDYYDAYYDYESATEKVELVKALRPAIGGKSGAGKVIDEEKEFRDKVKFYADLAKDILSMQRTAVNTTFEGLKDSADLMGKIKDKGILVPGQQVYIPPPPQMNMWKPLADMAGLPMGPTGQPVSRETWNNPDEYAKMLGVPGYAKGTPAYNGKSAIMNRNKSRFSSYIGKRGRR